MQEIKSPNKSKTLAKFYLWRLFEEIYPVGYEAAKKPNFPASTKTHCLNALEKLGIIHSRQEGRKRIISSMLWYNEFAYLYSKMFNASFARYYPGTRRITMLFNEPEFEPGQILKYSKIMFGKESLENAIKSIVILSRDFALPSDTTKEEDLKRFMNDTASDVNFYKNYLNKLPSKTPEQKRKRNKIKGLIQATNEFSEQVKSELTKNSMKFEGLD